MKLAIIGSRGFNNYDLLEKEVISFIPVLDIDLLISGGAEGADSLGEQFAKNFNIPTKIFRPDWKTNGRKAGYMRNVDIIRHSDLVIAFWDGQSKGTRHSISLALKTYRKPIRVIQYNNRTGSNSLNRW